VADPQFDSILGKGWRQGSIADQALAHVAGLFLEDPGKQHYVVVSHSCDLTNPKAELEPLVEVLRADVTEKLEAASSSARTPRRLALVAEDVDGTAVPLLMQMETRSFFSRELLISHHPNPDLHLSENAVKLLAIWMSRRYRRPELPTELVTRLGPQYGKFKDQGRKQRTTFSRILISLNSWEELPREQTYRAKILALLPPDQTMNQAARTWATTVDALLSDLPGVEVELTQVESESDVPISILREFRPLDFDFLSFAAGELDPPVGD
jgi:hypothetical protein